MEMMNRIRGVGMRRLANAVTVAAVTSGVHDAAAQSASTPVAVRGRQDTVFVIKRDTSLRASTVEPRIIDIRRVDSLLKRQESMPIGSEEYAHVQRELEATIFAAATRVVGPDGSVTIMVSPQGMQPSRVVGFGPVPKMMVNVTPRGWLGFTADGFHTDWTDADGFYVRYFEYPTVVEVDPDSPAAKVGVKFGDLLLAYDGIDLRASAVNLTRLLAPGRSVSVKLRREGEGKEFSMVVDKAPPAVEAERRAAVVGRMLSPSRPPMPDSAERRVIERQAARAVAAGGRGGGAGGRGSAFPSMRMPTAVAGLALPSGFLGARMTDLDPEALAALTQDKAKNGVVVSMVPPGTPAERMGLQAGDVIVSLGDVLIFSMSQLHRELIARASDSSTPFSVLRKGKIKRLTYEQR
jgi:S1-C subfamily serine protease